MASETARSCPVERIYEELGRREYKERNESAECFVEERLMRWAHGEYAELKLLKEKLCYYDKEEEEYIEEYTIGVDGNKAFMIISIDDDEDVDEVELGTESAEKIRSLILNAKSQDDFHMIWKIVSKYIDDAELETELA
jgi:hypothetical protein